MKPLTLTLLFITLVYLPAIAGPGDEALQQAQDLLGKGHSQEAISALSAGLAVEPDNPKLNILAGDIYLSLAKFDSSLFYYAKVLAKKGKDPDALYGAGISAYNLKAYDDALNYFQQGEKTGKLKPKFFYGIGLAFLGKSDFQTADINFRRAIDKDKKNPLYHLGLAEANYGAKVYSIAVSEFSKAIELDSSFYRYDRIHYKMAQSHLNMRNINGAIDEYKIDLQISPEDTTTWMELSRIYDISGNTPEAIFCYEKYLGIACGNGQAWFDLGKLYLKFPDQAKAANAFEQAVALNSNVAQSYGYLEKIYSDRKEYEKAFSAYTRYEAAFGPPDSVEYWFEKGKVLMKIGEKNAAYFDTALSAFNKSLALDSNFSAAFEYAGLTRYSQKDYMGARGYFLKKIALDSTSVNTFRNLAFCYLKTEQYSAAAKAFSKALDLKPDDIMMRSLLAKIYSFDKAFDKSVEQYEYILNILPNSASDTIKTIFYHGSDSLLDSMITTFAWNRGYFDSIRCEIYPDLGFGYLRLNNCQSAIVVLLKADKCKPGDFSILMNIAASYEFCNKIPDAHTYYQKALDLRPNDKEARKGLLRNTIQGK